MAKGMQVDIVCARHGSVEMDDDQGQKNAAAVACGTAQQMSVSGLYKQIVHLTSCILLP